MWQPITCCHFELERSESEKSPQNDMACLADKLVTRLNAYSLLVGPTVTAPDG